MYFVNINFCLVFFFLRLQHIPKKLGQMQNKSEKVIEYPR